MRFLFLVFISGVSISFLHAQSKPIASDYYNNLTPKTPEQFKFGTFGNTPINHYTALPEVSLPLMVLKGIETAIPINLSYDASGIRTDDISGPVGIKWTLQAGGSVVRDMNGRPDEGAETGFWKTAKQTNYFEDMDFTDWADHSQKNTRDTAPDEFAISINGRTIRFLFDREGIARTIPRQNIRITPTFVEIDDKRRIIRFDVVLENGTKYVFGGDLNTVEQREVETLRIGTHFLYTKVPDCPWRQVDNKYYYDCFKMFGYKFSSDVDFNVKTLPSYTSKWHLTSIIEPSGETTTFRYEKLGDVVYTTRPSTLRIQPICHPIPMYERKSEYCRSFELFGRCTSTMQTDYHYFSSIMVVSKFQATRPGSSPMPVAEIFNPMKYGWSPGAVNEYRTRITETNIRLVEILSSTKNRVTLKASLREDLPGSIKYDEIDLYNMQDLLVKRIKLNFSILEANKENDRCWISEALMMRQLSSLKSPATYLAADYFLNHTASDISGDNYRKFVFEGVKPYNYVRTFLSSVQDLTAASRPLTLFRFEYSDTDKLRRRTTTYVDLGGYHRSKVVEEMYAFGNRAVPMAQSYTPSLDIFANRVPLSGLLTRIHYPTNGSTAFIYGFHIGIRLNRILDLNEKGDTLAQREMEYKAAYNTWRPSSTSYQEFKVQGTSGWVKYLITASAPQNEPPLTHGVPEGHGEVIVYHGTKARNNGFERFNYTYPTDYLDSFSDMKSYPVEKDTNNIPYDIFNVFPFPPVNSADHLRGFLKRHQVFAAGSSLDKPLRETINTYAVNPYGYDPEHIVAFKGGSFMWTTSSSTHFFYGSETEAERRWRWGWTHFYTDWMVLTKTREITYDENDPSQKFVQVTEFQYDSIHQQQVERVTYNESNPGEKIVQRYKYVTHDDYVLPGSCNVTFKTCREKCKGTDECYVTCDQQLQTCLSSSTNADIQALVLMRRKFQYAIPVETLTLSDKNGVKKMMSAVVNRFVVHKPTQTSSSWSVKPGEIWVAKALDDGLTYKESRLTEAAPAGLALDARMRKVHTFNSYDLASGNVTRQTLLDGMVADYTWDAATNFSEVKSHTINPGAGQHQSNYQHIPLVGLKTVTDANSQNTTYQYDLNRRLKIVADHLGNVLSSVRYHFASEAQNDSVDVSFTVRGPNLVGSSIMFSARQDASEYGTTKFVWDFGDGSPKKETTSSSISYKYSGTGVYIVTLTKVNPEYGSFSSSSEIAVDGPFKIALCVDGPSQIDLPPGTKGPVIGSCTLFPMTLSNTKLKATATGACGAVTYRWERQNSAGTWEQYTTGTAATTVPPADFVNRVLGTYRIRCIGTDPCGISAMSNAVELILF